MARFCCIALIILALALTTAQTGRSQEAQPVGDPLVGVHPPIDRAINAQPHTCVIYKLDALGDDLELGKWIAETIPEVIEPGTWKGQGVLRYYGPKKILVVYHTPAVQTKVDSFLKSVKKSMPTKKTKTLSAGKPSTIDQGIVPTQYAAPGLLKASSPVPEPNPSYPVAVPARQPKHLFHFIIRYEGDGIIDDNVVKFMKVQYQSEKSKSKDSETASPSVQNAYPAPGLNIAPSAGTPTAGSSPLPDPSVAPRLNVAPSSAKKAPDDKKAEKEPKEDKQP